MIDPKLLEFYLELKEEIQAYLKINNGTASNAFKSVFLSYLTELGETLVSDSIIIDFKKDADNIKLDGYAYSEYFQSLTLLISKYNSKAEPEKIGKTELEKLFKKAKKFYKSCDSNYFDDLEESSDGFQAYQFVKEHSSDIETINIILLTNDLCTVQISDRKDETYGKITIKYDVWDIERLYQGIILGSDKEKKTIIRLKDKYDEPLLMIKVDENNPTYDCYIGVISGPLLAKIYKDEGQDLIQKNVRSFLQATGAVNKGIKSSLTNEPQMFMAYNNGISTVAEKIIAEQNTNNPQLITINEITGWQIVNGGQTTASIYNALKTKLPLDQVFVQMKLTVIKDAEKSEEIIHNISKYANSQNKINMSDFNANDPYHVQMENLSRRIFIPVSKGKSTEQWFYERARGQYLVELNRQPTQASKNQFKARCPKNRCISKTVAAKCMMAWQGYPSIVSKGLETNFVYFSEKIKNGEIPEPNEKTFKEMIAEVILFNSCDTIIKNLKFGDFKAQQDYYTIALLGKYFSSEIDLEQIWNNQEIDAKTAKNIETLAFFVWKQFQNPPVVGINIGQWCKKEDCWDVITSRYESENKQVD